ncbi:winged helix-turn-helix domain-containing protein [Oricola sp.]|uniref:winged helix-turn-helix domain-containing protein n=1 Tax=Oricola sp. TaxID=1979950 RepID=UPI0025D36987|nr:winged helix-turn-helix domain-containing protein [Oricola sp.]MCI5074739.1 winged helix-turn-helix domain-containing protein [Oricola sp.]
MTNNPDRPLHLRIALENDIAIGPGKADLLEGIRDTGSIAAAGRQMGMSYKRAWSLIEAMNTAFSQPVIETARGGSARGGARLTPTGETVLATYRHMMRAAESAIAPDVEILQSLLDPDQRKRENFD